MSCSGRNCRRSSRASMRSESGWIGPQGHEVAEHPVADLVARFDALNFVEFPMDAEINPALAVFFSGLAEAVKGARHQGSRLAVLVDGDGVEFIRNDREVDVVGAEIILHRFE